ncbi:MAG: hypothetical protein NTV04_19590 [Deltaproteobacteria bacterium]|nr:hypothetical protein [Deltaproteobacteria bacterium]
MRMQTHWPQALALFERSAPLAYRLGLGLLMQDLLKNKISHTRALETQHPGSRAQDSGLSTPSSVLRPQHSALYLRIADFTIALKSIDPTLKIQLSDPVGNFLAADGNPDINLHVSWGNLEEKINAPKIFESRIWQLYLQTGNYLFTFSSPQFGSSPYKLAKFNSDFSFGQIYLNPKFYNPNQPVDPLEFPLDELLLINRLSQEMGVEVHALGLELVRK